MSDLEQRIAELEAQVDRLAAVVAYVVKIDRNAAVNVLRHKTGEVNPQRVFTITERELKELILGPRTVPE